MSKYLGEASSVKKQKKKSEADRFTDSVFSWSLEDVFNEDLFKSKVQKIPETFESVKHYLGSFVNPLLEEIRAELQSSMDVLHRAPYAEMISSEEAKPRGTKTYQIKVDYWRNKANNGGRKEPYNMLPGDVFILAHGKPQSVFDLQRAGKSWAFLSLVGIKGDRNATQFTCKASKEFEHKTQMYLIFLANLIPQKRIWEALHMSSNVMLINKVLRIDSAVKKKCVGCSKINKSVQLEKSENSVTSELNESQTGAILSCLHMLQCTNGSSFELIWGPPGTGKTKTTSTLLVSLLRMKCKTLVCAPTNVAIIEVASRVLKLVSDAQPGESLCSLGDILLFGTKERLNIGSDTEDIYLDHRVEKLAECFGPLGWKHCFTSMINLLENCVFLIASSRENELTVDREQSYEGRIEEMGHGRESENGEKKKNPSLFLEYFRERFDSALSELKSCVSITCTHTAKSYILDRNFKSMVSTICLLDSFRALLFQADVVSEALEELFRRREVIEEVSHSPVDKTSLLLFMKRSECLSSLRTLRDSLNKLEVSGFKSERAIKKFCFETASLIFCTVSSSAKLHKLRLKPTILIIDEAAQLKESESTIPLQLPSLKHAILVGDEWQLPATVKSKVSMEAGFGRSLFERLSSQNYPKHLLNMQYRMHPSISVFPNSEFYHKQIQDAEIVKSKSYEKRFLPGSMFGPYSFINIVGGSEEKEEAGHSLKNMVEVAVILKILLNLHKAWLRSQCELSVGIVSPYAAQVAAIQGRLGKKYDNIPGFQVKAKTVDGFQGGEEDIIIMSTVRSSRNCSLEFISKPQRINVALTRARRCLWILGSEKTLVNSQTVWGAIIVDAKNRGCFFNADCNEGLSKAITEVKKEFGQFDDILNTNSILFKSSKWKVFFSDNFMKSFKKLTSFGTRKAVIDLLLKLSDGWRPQRRMAAVSESSLEIKSFKVSSLCVVSTIDVELTNSGYTQVLRIWDLLPLEDIPEFVTHLDRIFEKYSDDFTTLCNEKCFEGKLEIPKSWPPALDIVRFKDLSLAEAGSDSVASASNAGTCVVISRFGEISLGMKFYSLSNCVVNHLLSDRDARELDFPFELPDQEKEIILFHRSVFVLGRPGTGKTTVLIMKLFQKEYLHSMAMDGFYGIKSNGIGHVNPNRVVKKKSAEAKENVLRQLFVTASLRLCNSVKQRLSFLRSSSHSSETTPANIDGDDCEEAEFKIAPLSFHNVPLDSYPLVITVHQFLLMLDRTLSKSYFEKFINISELSQIQNPSSELDVLQFLLRTKEVNHERFSSQYWPRLFPQLKKKLDPSSVFTEIVSRIKGGLRAMEASDGKLTRENYVKSTEGCGRKLSRKKREQIYDIFEIYELMKVENGEFDPADFTNDLHLRLKHERYKGDEMNFVYVDEVQDLTMSQFALFKHVCNNVEEGFVFSGDTIQTISRGANFRIRDIRSLFYKKFVLGSKRKQKEREDKDQITRVFHLTQNFRTHSGILNLSQSIIELLYHFFASSIDIIEPETTIIHGDAPVILQSVNNEDALSKLFGDRGNIIRRSNYFGAEQVIVVRDESDQKKIKDRVGKKAIILTISECKDLEFQDVLLYNFFGSSPLRKQWTVIYDYMKEQGSFDSTTLVSPLLDKSEHNILLDELKQLYVTVSRSKQRLWICDDGELSKPMFDFWKKKHLVQARQVDDLLAWEMQVSSTLKEWKSRGIQLYYKHNHEMATLCFEKARDTFWEKKSKAAGLEAMAHRVHSSNPREANSLLREAAEIFKAIGITHSAARCSSDSKDYGKAGRVYVESFGKLEFQRAGRECFSPAGCYKLAADVYAKHSLYSECLALCTKGELFDEGLQHLQCWKQLAKKECDKTSRCGEIVRIEQEFLENCALHYYGVGLTESMMKVVKSFASMNLVRSFLRPLGCLDELMSLEVETGNFAKAAEIAKLKGDVLLAASLLGKAEKFGEAAILILSYVLSSSLWSSGKKGWPLQLFKQKNSLLTYAKLLAENETQGFYEFVCSEADVMENKKTDLVMRKDQLNASRRHKSIGGEILSARKILDTHLASALSNYLCEEDLVLDLMKHSEDIVSQNQISTESLVYFWNLWKQKILGIFEYLGCLGTEDGGEFKDYGEFCLSFLGVWKQFHDMNTIYVLINSDADWARNTEKIPVCNGGKSVCVDACQFVSAAHSYWSSEVLSVGFVVLHKLEDLYTTMNQKSDLLFGKCRTLTLINEVAKFLLQSKFLKRTDKDYESLQKFMTLSTDDFVGHVFPFDSRKASTDNLSFLRETEFCKKFLKQIVLEYINSTNKLSYWQIGSLAVVILGSGKLNDEVFKTALRRINCNQPWKAFFETLSRSRGLYSPNQLLIYRFQEALVDAFDATRRAEYECMSPICFLYLVERLLIWAFSFQGYITTKSYFVEWLPYQEIDTNNMPSFNVSVDFQASLLGVVWSIINVIRQCLVDKANTIKWIKRSATRVDECYSILVSRMVVMICLLYANYGMCLDLLFDLLGRDYIAEQLPEEFCDALKSQFLSLNLNVLAKAFKKMGNSLVIVNFGENFSKHSFPDAILVDIKVNQCKDNILRTLSENRVGALKESSGNAAMKESSASAAMGASDSCKERASSTSTCAAAKSWSDEISHSDSHTKNKHEGNMPMGYVSFWGIFDGINSEGSGRHERNCTYDAQTMKVNVEKYVRLLTGSLQRIPEFEGKNLSEVFYMIDELKQLSAALDARNTSLAEELSKRLQSRRPRMEGVLNQLFHQHKADHGNERLETVIASTSHCDKDGTSTSARNISKPDEGNSKASQARIPPLNNAKAAATRSEESKGGCHIL